MLKGKQIHFEKSEGMKRKTILVSGRMVEGFIWSVPGRGEAKRERAAKAKLSTAARKEINGRRAEQKLARILCANFPGGAAHVTLTYEGDAPGYDEAVRRVKLFFRKFRAVRQAAGAVFKYAYITEYLHAREHHHFVMDWYEGMERDLSAAWGIGLVDVERLDGEDGYQGIAHYFCKEAQREEKKFRRKWTCSLNMEKPERADADAADHDTLTVPQGCTVLDRREERNEYGEFVYIKYLAPRKSVRAGAQGRYVPERGVDVRCKATGAHAETEWLSTGRAQA